MNLVSSTEWPYDVHGAIASSLVDRRALAKLGAGLRGMYKHVTDEPVPEPLAEFVRELERRERLPAERAR